MIIEYYYYIEKCTAKKSTESYGYTEHGNVRNNYFCDTNRFQSPTDLVQLKEIDTDNDEGKKKSFNK